MHGRGKFTTEMQIRCELSGEGIIEAADCLTNFDTKPNVCAFSHNNTLFLPLTRKRYAHGNVAMHTLHEVAKLAELKSREGVHISGQHMEHIRCKRLNSNAEGNIIPAITVNAS